MQIAGAALYLYQTIRAAEAGAGHGHSEILGQSGEYEALAPSAETPFFFSKIGKTFPATGSAGIAWRSWPGASPTSRSRGLNEATVRVLQKNGCEVVIPGGQNCCGALHLHSGLRNRRATLARNNIDAVVGGKFDAIITNAAGCGSTLKEYDQLLEDDPAIPRRQPSFRARMMKDVTEFLASIELNREMGRVEAVVTYQDSCHLAHGQKITEAPRQTAEAVPGLIFREMPMADLCCGSAGIYNVVQNEMAMQILEHKMESVAFTKAEVIVTANPGCMLHLRPERDYMGGDSGCARSGSTGRGVSERGVKFSARRPFCP